MSLSARILLALALHTFHAKVCNSTAIHDVAACMLHVISRLCCHVLCCPVLLAVPNFVQSAWCSRPKFLFSTCSKLDGLVAKKEGTSRQATPRPSLYQGLGSRSSYRSCRQARQRRVQRRAHLQRTNCSPLSSWRSMQMGCAAACSLAERAPWQSVLPAACLLARVP